MDEASSLNLGVPEQLYYCYTESYLDLSPKKQAFKL